MHHQPVEVWGDRQIVGDYLFIDDDGGACLRLIEQRELSGTSNIGSGPGTSISALIALAQTVTGRAIEVIARPARDVDVRAIVLDSTLVGAATGWVRRLNWSRGYRVPGRD